MLEFVELGVVTRPSRKPIRAPALSSARGMSPSGSSTQISGTTDCGEFFCRRASRNKFAGSNTDGAAKSFPARIGGNRDTSDRLQRMFPLLAAMARRHSFNADAPRRQARYFSPEYAVNTCAIRRPGDRSVF